MTSSTRRQSPTALWAGTDTCTPCWWTAVARLTLGLEDLLTFAYFRIAHRQGRGGNVSPCRSHDCFNSRRSKGIFHAHTTAALLNSRSNALYASGNGRPSACMRWWVMLCIFWADNAPCGLQSASSKMLPCVSMTPIWTTSLSLENPVVSVSIMSTSVRPRNMSNPFMYLVTGALSICSIVEAAPGRILFCARMLRLISAKNAANKSAVFQGVSLAHGNGANQERSNFSGLACMSCESLVFCAISSALPPSSSVRL